MSHFTQNHKFETHGDTKRKVNRTHYLGDIDSVCTNVVATKQIDVEIFHGIHDTLTTFTNQVQFFPVGGEDQVTQLLCSISHYLGIRC